MKTKCTFGAAAIGLLLEMSTVSAAGVIDSLADGQVKLDTRLRYEAVSADNKPEDASALTLSTRLGFETGSVKTVSGYIEMLDSRTVFGLDEFSSGDANVKVKSSDYAVIADPAITVLNQAYIKAKPIAGLTMTGGRQRLILDNARFVGNVGWRQNEQTFDAFRVQYKKDSWYADTSFIGRVKGIEPKFNAKADHFLFNAGYKSKPFSVAAYYYDLDQSSSADIAFGGATFDHATAGVSFSGKPSIKDIKFNYALSYATQSVNSLNQVKQDLSVDYFSAELGFTVVGVNLSAGLEQLGSDNGQYGFQTPLATKHAFNGWADQFLVTPTTGLQDTYIKTAGKVAGVKLLAVYHQYDAVEGEMDFGSEINLLAAKKFVKKYTLGVKYANFSQGDLDSPKVDTSKYWLWLAIKL